MDFLKVFRIVWVRFSFWVICIIGITGTGTGTWALTWTGAGAGTGAGTGTGNGSMTRIIDGLHFVIGTGCRWHCRLTYTWDRRSVIWHSGGILKTGAGTGTGSRTETETKTATGAGTGTGTKAKTGTGTGAEILVTHDCDGGIFGRFN
eukprot:CAMPEP_0172499604 /NCGR_PEP_ID=MMETSP1066-20121228/128576_1 /TAXON_ID=671091 /ORGANISM="Coscinodiscus wailesii, Strain CCMP2513" /LENGTH=147 /DNA_ID=CAMNT_0013273419 /DNA_START=61 /DNA_END=504 /DNA_ORIENTATION=+